MGKVSSGGKYLFRFKEPNVLSLIPTAFAPSTGVSFKW